MLTEGPGQRRQWRLCWKGRKALVAAAAAKLPLMTTTIKNNQPHPFPLLFPFC